MSPDRASAKRRRVYLDTSAYLCILLGEEGWEELSEDTQGAELLSSVLLLLETKRNLIRLAREGSLTPEHYRVCMEQLEADVGAFALRDLTLELCTSNILPAVATPRSLDLGHIRTALWFHSVDHIDRFLTKDAAQEEAAKDLGLPVATFS